MPSWWMFGSFLRDRTPGAGSRVNGKVVAKRRGANKRARQARRSQR